MAQAFQIAPAPIYKAEKLVRDPLYRRWIRRFACLGCGSTRNVDPCHTGPHCLGTKSSDETVLPLCRECHDKFDKNQKKFAREHGFNILERIRHFNRLWRLRQR